MRLDVEAWVARLAFGSAVPKLKSCLGMHFDAEAIHVCEVAWSGTRPKVEHLLRIPVPPELADPGPRNAGTLNVEFFGKPDRLIELLKGSLNQIQWGSRHAVATFSPHFGLLRYFTMPAIDRRFWKTAIPAEAKKYVPIAFTELAYDYQVLQHDSRPERRGACGVLFGVTHRRNTEGVRAILGGLGIRLLGVELSPCSLERLWDVLEPGTPPVPCARIHFDEGMARILLSEHGVPIFFREVSLGVHAGGTERRKVDLASCLDFARKQLGAQKPVEVRLDGTPEDSVQWQETISRETGLPVRVQKTAQSLGLQTEDWAALASVGGALRCLSPAPMDIDLGGSGGAREEDKLAVYGIFALSGAAFAFLMLVGAGRGVRTVLKSGELSRLTAQGKTIEAFQNKTADQIQALLKDMEARASAFNVLSASTGRLAEVLGRVAESVPAALWITKFSYASSLGLGSGPGGPAPRRTLSLGGNVMGASAAEEQDVAIGFGQVLQRDERFNKWFSCGGASVQVNAASLPRQDQSPSTPQQLGAMQENRTSFTIECVSQRT